MPVDAGFGNLEDALRASREYSRKHWLYFGVSNEIFAVCSVRTERRAAEIRAGLRAVAHVVLEDILQPILYCSEVIYSGSLRLDLWYTSA
jgi:hypothetical protein